MEGSTLVHSEETGSQIPQRRAAGGGRVGGGFPEANGEQDKRDEPMEMGPV